MVRWSAMRWVGFLAVVLPLSLCSAQELVSFEGGLEVEGKIPKDVIEIGLAGLPEDANPMRFVRIPGGAFPMGSPENERGRHGTEGPVHSVTVAYDFYLGETEITKAQWNWVMGGNPDQLYDPATNDL